MTKRVSITGPVAAKTIRTEFQNGNLDASTVPALDKDGNPRTDKDGNTVLADTASIFGKDNSGVVRGRLNPAFVAVFLAANPKATYAEKSAAESRTVEVPLTKMNAKGARLKRPEKVAVSEVRRLAGSEGKAGRLSSADVRAAADAIMAERGWDAKPTA
jgi:rRNA maturation endonuclease Nob1